jgi:citrate lyase subunit beta/citryl-CoA lyase
MTTHSWLFVPADSEKKLSKTHNLSARAFILDLEDSVALANKAVARQRAADFLRQSGLPRERLWIRINPLDGPYVDEDLAAVMPAAPGGIVLPKARSPQDVEELSGRLERLEDEHGIEPGSTRILPIVTETPGALFSLGGYAACGPRLAGLTWGAEDLGSAIGATATRDLGGEWTPPFRLVRNLCLFAAHAAGVPAIDTVFVNFADFAELDDECEEARRDGFSGKLAIHPAQVDIINRAFRPSEEELERARKIVDLFKAHPDAAVLEFEGAMVDLPHLKQAQRILDP